MHLTTALGFPVGLLLGFLFEYLNFNMGTALRSVMFEGSKHNLRAYLTILVVNILIVHFLVAVGLVQTGTVPFFWPAVAVGGFLFGLGMSLGAGCTNVWHGTGTGASGLAFALLGFIFGAHVVRTPLFSPLFLLLRRHIVQVHGRPVTLYTLIAANNPALQWLVAVGAAVLLVVWIWQSTRRRREADRSWLVTGLAIGATAIVAWLVARLNGDTYGLSFTHPTLALGRVVFVGDVGALYWGALMILGVPIGVFLAARRKRALYFHIPSTKKILRLTGSGTLTGFGASLAGGCNVGHGITGVSLLSVSSMTATVAAMAAIWLSTFARNRFGGGTREPVGAGKSAVSLSREKER